jgi:hypothetical protein
MFMKAIVRDELDAVAAVVKYGATDDGHIRVLLEILAVFLGWREQRYLSWSS